ncbi:hypothetical protein [Beijerinckia indica]|uniref:DUF2267 domain-containing protein n=1 Tax=Beijerinckia indica subsp. indica (strain ATCC 9039 / DSM 1715 / NCIMB 8712) TaxID=395963 RepID=B2IC11_BEII9|nr:hypothetical protein [Beijerinckia indica]ACB95266.1 conserved hypothetical protein [Beijerinckia indica subsp. indica ATCC 9039]
MEELVSQVALRAGLAPEVTGQAIAVIFAFLRKEGPAQEIDSLFATISGAAEAAATKADAFGGGLFGGFMSKMGGGVMMLAGQLTSLGLGINDMQSLGKALFENLREKVGEEHLGRIAAAIPGLSQLL